MRPTALWFLQLVTGGLIFIFLGIHMVMMHVEDILAYLGIHIQDPTSWKSMIERAQQGSWLVFYVLLLVFVVYHGLYGLRAVITETISSPRTEHVLNWVYVGLGIAAIAVGTYVPVKLF